ncbi:uncharacterized protein TNIN_66131 [Trichonephila inaurata madagascariensis]|uniref:Vesicular, overexpressed in cancer, prosurvival protein 1 n=1 Tax=Trichonephila inaurata madagascariensis TaxID=2747483 RepID=A0A8X6XDQ0_9ARAC|nr:uncharacterized protein TNIN_66131 [Trichonephila inaurata madagascariensis]
MEKYCDVSRFLFFSINVLLLVNQVSAYYCNHDLCRSDQYCCGDNLCCDYVYSPWYFWAGVVIMILILSACGGLFRYCYESNSYVVMHSANETYYPCKGAVDEDKGLTSVVVNRRLPHPILSPNIQISLKIINDSLSMKKRNIALLFDL